MKALFLLITPLFLFAQCTYTLNLTFNLEQQQLNAQATIHNNSQSIQLYTDDFDIENKETLINKLNNGANKVRFNYTYNHKQITKNFIYLLNNWYPKTQQACAYTITHNLKSPFVAIGEQTNKAIQHATFIASRQYKPQFTQYKDITIGTYFFKHNPTLSQRYFDKTIEYIKLYEKLIAPYPFKHFNIVENQYTTGYSMPTYTLIGSYLLNKEYVLNRSLGHELLHQYFGNSLWVNPLKGNYHEGLTTYLSDDYYERLKGLGVQNRKSNLLSFHTFAKKPFKAKDFVSRQDKNSMAIGYTKVSFIFSMLEDKLGTELFYDILRKFYRTYAFKEANLDTLQSFFQQHSKTDLRAFFNQWFNTTDTIDFKLSQFKRQYKEGHFFISFKLEQKKPMQFNLPLDIETYHKPIKKIIPISKKEQYIQFKIKTEPLSITADKNIQLFRTFFANEKPLNMGTLLNAKLLLVVDDNHKHKYTDLTQIFKNSQLISSKTLSFEQLKNNNVVFLDKHNSLITHFFPRTNLPLNSDYINMEKNTYNKDKIMALIHVQHTLPRSFYLLKHYAIYKTLIKKQKHTQTILDKTTNGFTHRFDSKASFKEITEPKYFDALTPRLLESKIIYASESHTNFTHHLNQLRVIQNLYKYNKNITIGMEMFQKPFQPFIDEYLKQNIDLNTFLKQTQYYKNWRYDYDLYKPIIDFAQQNRIPIIALNASRQLVREVGQKGILKIKDKTQLPQRIDQSNIDYKEDLSEIFAQHEFKPISKTENNNKKDFFFQSQLIWDETMAQSITDYMKKNPKKTMVVLVGSGHVQQHVGIPSRVFQDTQLPYKVILNDSNEGIQGDIIISNNQEIKLKPQLKLGVYLTGENELKVLDTIENSLGEKLKIQKDDVIIKLNEYEVNNISDLKRVLYFAKNVQHFTAVVKRENKKIVLKWQTMSDSNRR